MPNIKRTSKVKKEQIIKLRGKITQLESAELLKISRRTFQNYESGKVAMRKELFEYFKTAIEQYLKGK